jgi:hypothetical protein
MFPSINKGSVIDVNDLIFTSISIILKKGIQGVLKLTEFGHSLARIPFIKLSALSTKDIINRIGIYIYICDC